MKSTPQPETTQPGNAVELHIEELVLQGFAPGTRHRVSSAVQSELARLLSEGDLAGFRQNPPSLARLDAGAFQVQAGAKPQATGTEIARAVFRSLQQQSRAGGRRRGRA